MSERIVQHDFVAHDRFKELIKQFNIQTIVETGTCGGEGTVTFGQFVPLVISSEIIRRSWENSCVYVRDNGYPWHWMQHDYMRCFHGKNGWVVLAHGDSPAVIRDIMSPNNKDCVPRPILWFLDAHWLGVWPLQEELKAIAEADVPDSVIMIHDFFSPGTPFQGDTYNGQRLDLDYVKGPLLKINPSYRLEWNTKTKMTGGRTDPGIGILYAYPQ